MTISSVLPDSLDGWGLSTTRIWGELRVTARRNGTTIHMVRMRTGLWTLTRFRSGRIVATTATDELPPEIEAALEAAWTTT